MLSSREDNDLMKKIVTLLFALLVWGGVFSVCQSAQAATIYVNSATGNDTTGAGTVGNPYKTVTKGYTMAATGDVLDLSGTFTWTDTDETADAAGSGFTVNKNLTIRGQGVGSTIVQAHASPNTADRSVFTIPSGRTVTLQDMTIRHGSTVLGNAAGGVISAGTLTLLRTRVTANRYNSINYYGAGGVYADTNSTITLTNTTVDHNTFIGRYYGSGGMYALQNVGIVIEGSTFNDNSATGDTPGAFAYSYAAPSGGLGMFRFGAFRSTNNTFTGNSTNAYGGGLQIYYKDSVKMTNTTVVANTASLGAGGILYQSEWDGYTLFLKNSLLANNTGVSGAASDFYAYDAASGNRVTSNGYNIVEASTNKTFAATGDITGNQASLNIDTTLADNSTASGTQTLALLAGSVAINAGDPANGANSGIAIPTADQRNVVRIATTDIGAYEYGTPVVTYTFTYTAGANGSITGTSPQTVTAGANGTAVTAVPATGYHFVDWSDASTTNPRTDMTAAANVTVTANFATNTYALTYAAGANGSLTGSASQTVNYGANGTAVTAVPATGYHFVNWSDATTTNPRTDLNVTGNVSATATFAINTYTLAYTAGAHGTLTGSSSQMVTYGASGSAVTAVPDAGYSFIQWSDASTTNPRTDLVVAADVTVTASFADITAPTLSTIVATAGSATATITWTTNEQASTQVAYGATTAYGTTTTLADTSPRVTSHSVALSDLTTCTTYHYRVYSVDAASNSTSSADGTFTTGSCPDPVVSGGGAAGSAFVPPSGVGDGEKDVLVGMYEARDLGVIGTRGINALVHVGSGASFQVQALVDGVRIPGAFKLSEVDLMRNEVDLSFTTIPQLLSLRIGQSMNVDLNGDKVDDLQIMFRSVWINRVELTMKALVAPTEVKRNDFVTLELTPVSTKENSPCTFKFTRTLKVGQTGEDVKALQGCLKKRGFPPLLKNGKPVETLTMYFGPATRDALVRFQKVNRMPSTGYFGSMSMLAMGKSAFALK